MTEFRKLVPADQEKLWHWLHIALWDPPPAGFRPKSVLEEPHVRIYAEDWGRDGDVGVVAIDEGVDIGACWVRLLPENVGLAYIDDKTPQLGIGLEPEHQRKGHGTALMKAGLEAAVSEGYEQISLTVHPANPARKLYDKCGFVEIGVRNKFVLMLWKAGIE